MKNLMYALFFNVVLAVNLSAVDYGAESNLTGDPIGGGKGYSDIKSALDATDPDYIVDTKAELLSALGSAASGDIIFVEGDAEIDLSGESRIVIPAGVTLASDRGAVSGSSVAPGALLYGSDTGSGLFSMTGAGGRITGLRIEGEDPEIGDFDHDTVPLCKGILTYADSIEVDNCEISGWGNCGINCRTGTVSGHIHHNYFHHNRRVGWGYGVCVDYGTEQTPVDVLIEANLFSFHKHAIASVYQDYSNYEARYNIDLAHAHSHSFDRHGAGGLDGLAGHDTIIHHNTFRNRCQSGVAIRGEPAGEALIYNNWFYHDSANSSPAPVNLYTATNCSAYDNHFGLTPPTGTTLPVVNATASPTSGTSSLNVSFSASGTGLDGYYLWDFGDGNEATGSDPSHTYGSAGRYLTTVMGRNSDGVPEFKTMPVLVKPDNGEYVLSAWVKDGCRSNTLTGYYKKYIIINDGVQDHVVWSDDVAGDEGWQHVVVDVTDYVKHLSEATLKLRVKCESSAWDPANNIEAIEQLDVYWDDVIIFGAEMSNGDFESPYGVWQYNETVTSWYRCYETGEARSGAFSYRFCHYYGYVTTAGSYAETTQKIRICGSDHRLIGHWQLDEGSVDSSTGLCGAWLFDDASGSTAEDSSAEQNDGTISGAAWSSAGMFGSALDFDGTDDYVDCGSDSIYNFNTTNAFTVCCWIKPDVLRLQGIVGKFYSSNGRSPFQIGMMATGTVYMMAGGGSVFGNVYIDSSDFTGGQWSHLAMTYDGNTLKAYLNGEEKDSDVCNITITSTTNPVTVGRLGGPYFDGMIDEVKLYSRALSEVEIAKAMNQTDDSSGRGNDAAVKNAGQAQCWASGKIYGGFDFDGTDDYIEITDDGTGKFDKQKFTVSAWFKSDVDPDDATQVIWSYDQVTHCSPYYAQHLRLGGSGSKSDEIAFIWNDGSTYHNITVHNALAGTQYDWHHVAATFKYGEQKLYLDGELIGSASYNDTISYYGQEVWIGKANFGGYFDGIIDDVRIYDESLSADEVKQLYFLGTCGGFWRLDDASGTTAADSSGQQNDGTLTAMDISSCWVSGMCDSALDFDGTDDYVEVVSDGTGKFDSQEFTIAAWLQSDADPDDAVQVIWSYDYTSHGSLYYAQHLRLGGASGASDEITFAWNNGSSYNYITAAGALTGAQYDWHHVAVTFKYGEQKIYLDGELVAGTSYEDTITYCAQEVWIGKGNFGGCFDGIIDEVKFYPEALDAASIREIYRDVF